MFCSNCGNQLNESSLFCSACGTAVKKSEPPPPAIPDVVLTPPPAAIPAPIPPYHTVGIPDNPIKAEAANTTVSEMDSFDFGASIMRGGVGMPELSSAANQPVSQPDPVAPVAPTTPPQPVSPVAADLNTPLPPHIVGNTKEKVDFGKGALAFCLMLIAALAILCGVFLALYLIEIGYSFDLDSFLPSAALTDLRDGFIK